MLTITYNLISPVILQVGLDPPSSPQFVLRFGFSWFFVFFRAWVVRVWRVFGFGFVWGLGLQDFGGLCL